MISWVPTMELNETTVSNPACPGNHCDNETERSVLLDKGSTKRSTGNETERSASTVSIICGSAWVRLQAKSSVATILSCNYSIRTGVGVRCCWGDYWVPA